MTDTITLNAGGPPVVAYGVEIAMIKATTLHQGNDPPVQQAVLTVTPLNQPPVAAAFELVDPQNDEKLGTGNSEFGTDDTDQDDPNPDGPKSELPASDSETAEDRGSEIEDRVREEPLAA